MRPVRLEKLAQPGRPGTQVLWVRLVSPGNWDLPDPLAQLETLVQQDRPVTQVLSARPDPLAKLDRLAQPG